MLIHKYIELQRIQQLEIPIRHTCEHKCQWTVDDLVQVESLVQEKLISDQEYEKDG